MDLTRALNILSRKKEKVSAPAQIKQKEYANTIVVTCPHCDFEHPEAPQQSCAIYCGNCWQPFQITITNTATGKRITGDKQSRDHIEYIKTYTTKPVKGVEKKPLPDIRTLEEATEQYRVGHITEEEFRELTGSHPDWKVWNLEKGRNPFYPVGDNRSRESGFTHHPFKNPYGIVFQSFVKVAIYRFIDFSYGTVRALYAKDKAGRLKRWVLRRFLILAPGVIEYANKTMQTQYDKDSFVFEDPFLLAIRNLMIEHINADFQWDYGRVQDLLLKGTDLSLAVLKEDMPYRAKFKLIINDLVARYPNGFELTEAEKAIQKISNDISEKVKKEGGVYVYKMPDLTK